MPRVNLSTTNKTTQQINLSLLDQRNPLVGKHMGKLVNNYFGDEQNNSRGEEHRRMQSLMTDPQFIT